MSRDEVAPVAIVGVGCRMPGADSARDYWQMIQEGRSAIGPVPDSRLNRELYLNPEKGIRGRSYSELGGIVSERLPDPATCPLPEQWLKNHDIAHLMMCEVAAAALRDAGMNPFQLPTHRAGVYVGHAGGSCLGGDIAFSTCIEEVAAYLSHIPSFASLPEAQRREITTKLAEEVHADYPRRSKLGPQVGASCVSSLIAKAFHLTGPTVAIDAACASSLVALSMGVHAIQQGQIDLAVVGGASYSKWYGMVLFSMAQSISATGSRPFDANADGLISSDGYAVAVLKSLDRAEADGDPILGVIRGIGLSCDGRGKSLWAPRKEGQIHAVRRAYQNGITPNDLQFVECHATSTQVGDATELSALSEVFRAHLPQGKRIPIGSVKANIGHTLETAGIAGLVKLVQAMRHGMIPPQINFKTPNPDIDWANSPFVVPTEAREWSLPAGAEARHGAVNAFGIGGVNVHVVLDDRPTKRTRISATVSDAPTSSVSVADAQDDKNAIAVVGMSVIAPGAQSLEEYWSLLQSGRDPKCDAPADRWNADIFCRTPGDQQFRFRTARGGFITDFEFDWKKHKVPPKQVVNANPLQFMLLTAAEQALEEAGYNQANFDRQRCGVVVGTVFGGDFGCSMQMGLRLPEVRKRLTRLLAERGVAASQIESLLDEYEEEYLRRMPALLDETGSFTSSTLASRLTKTFDLMGGAVALDADDVSSEAAFLTAANLLKTGACDSVVCAGAQRSMDVNVFSGLDLVGILGQDGTTSPLDTNSDGVVPGEGVGVLVLKRLADAREQGLPIRAVIRHCDVSFSEQNVTQTDESSSKPQPIVVDALSSTVKNAGLVELAGGVVPESNPSPSDTTDKPPTVISTLAGQLGHTFGASGVLGMIKVILELEHGKSVREFGLSASRLPSTPAITASTTEHSLYDTTGRGTTVGIVKNISMNGLVAETAVEGGNGLPKWVPPVSTPQSAPAGQTASTPEPGGKLAFLFPGQGSQYAGMLIDLIPQFSGADEICNEIDAVLSRRNHPSLRELFTDRDQRLGADPLLTQLAMLLADTFAWRLMQLHGVSPDMVTGHSFGEIVALHAAGAITFEDAVHLTEARAAAGVQHLQVPVQMAATTAPAELIERVQASLGAVYVANENSPEQTVVAGTMAALQGLQRLLTAEGFAYRVIPVPAPFHTPLMEPAANAFAQAIQGIPIQTPRVAFLSGVSFQLETDPNRIRQNLVAQLTQPVRWPRQIDTLKGHGSRLFFECGPQTILTRLIKKSITDGSVETHSFDDPRASATERSSKLRETIQLLGGRTVPTPSDSAPAGQSLRETSAMPHAQKTGRVSHFDATERRRARVRQQAAGGDANATSRTKPSTAPKTAVPQATPNPATSVPAPPVTPPEPLAPPVNPTPTPESTSAPQPAPAPSVDRAAIETFMIDFIVDQTGYPPEMVELDADLEADLGVDSIKKAQLIGELAEQFSLTHLASQASVRSLDDFPTLTTILDFVTASPTGDAATSPAPAAEPTAPARPTPPAAPVADVPPTPAPAVSAASNGAPALDRDAVQAFMVDFIVDQTGYPPEMVELDADLEADLGVDSIKKAQLIGELAEQFSLTHLASQASVRSLDDFPTLTTILDFVTAPPAENTTASDGAAPLSPAEAPAPSSPPTTAAPPSNPEPAPVSEVTSTPSPAADASAASLDRDAVQAFMVDFIVDQTGYPPEMVELDADLEADLGVDSIKKAQLIGELAEEFSLAHLASQASVRSLDDFPTLTTILDFVTAPPAGDAATSPAPATEPTAPAQPTPPAAPVADVPPTPAPAVSAESNGAPALDRDAVQAFMVDFIVDQTGYPPEMVELDADLEADLGVDSIKKAQLIGELAEEFSLTHLASQASVRSLDDFPTLTTILDFVTAPATDGAAPETSPAPAAARVEVIGNDTSGQFPTQPVEVPADSRIVLACEGSPYEMGLQHGKTYADDVCRMLDREEEIHLTAQGRGADDLKAIVARPEEYFSPQDVDELRGVADGASVPLDRIISHNVSIAPAALPGCTQFALAAQRNHGLGLIHAANEDSSLSLTMPDCLKRIVQVRRPNGLTPYVTFSIGGQVAGLSGMNAHGLAVTSTLLLNRRDPNEHRDGWKHPVLVKRLLESAHDIDSAIELVRSYSRSGTWSLCLSHQRSDTLCYLEYDGNELAVSRDQTRVATTNHCVLLNPRLRVPDHSAHRLARLEELLESGKVDSSQAQSILRDRFDRARDRFTTHRTMNTICRVDNQVSLVFQPANREVWVTAGPSADKEGEVFHRIEVGALLDKPPANSNGHVDAGAAAPSSPVSVRTEPATIDETPLVPESERRMQRRVLRIARSAHQPPQNAVWQPAGNVLILGDGEVASGLEEQLRSRGVTVRQVSSTTNWEDLEPIVQSLLASGPWPHLFVVTGREQEAASSNAIENWSDRAGRGLLSPYFFIQAWGRHLAENQLVNQATLVGVASLGGDFGTNLATVPAVETGGLCGLLKGIHREVPDMTVKAIDVPAAESATSVVEACLAELSLGRPEVEVSYRRKVRYTPTLLTAPSSQCQPGRPPEQGGVWVVTGGARGVTAVVARELARKYGLRLHLVGSSTLPEIDPKWKNASPQELAAFKKEVSAAALKAGQKPAEQWKRTEKAIEMDRTLSEYTAAGVTYTYHRCDVSNAADVSALLDQIRATDGPISGVIHGAGIESASRFDRKTRGIVEATVSIKVGGAVALMQATRQDPLTHFIGFGSTSGRFGGLGQTDYSLASDLLCKMCAWLGVERPEVRSVGIHWPPWDEVGMAARPESRLALSASGLTFMPPLEGAAHVLDEVALAPTEAEVVFVDQLGDLDSDGTMQAGQSSDVDAKSSGVREQALIDQFVSHSGNTSSFETVFDPERTAMLDAHRHRKVPIFPGVGSLEGFCELFRIEHPQTSAFDLSNVTIERGLRFHSARPQRVTWNAQGDADAMQCELVSDFRDRRGRLIDVNRTYSKGLVAAAVAGERLVTRDPGAQPTDGWVPAPYYSDWESMNGDDDRPYHAAPLNGLTSLRSVADGTWLKVTVRDDSDLRPSATPNNFATSPTALDACLLGVELTNFWKHGVTSLPVRFGQVRIHRRPEAGEECIARIWELGRDEQAKASRADIVLFDSQGRVVAELKDFVHADVSASPGTPDSMRRPEWRNASEPVSTPASPTATGSSTSGEMSLPLITDWQQTGPTTGQGRFDLDTAADPFLKEHRLNDRPILPAVIGLEALVEGAATSLDVESDTIVVENFEVLRPLRLDDATTRTLTVRVSDLGQGLECRLESEDGSVCYQACRVPKSPSDEPTFIAEPGAPHLPMNPYVWPDGPIYHGEPFRCLQEMFLWRDGGWGTLTAKAAGELLGSHRSGTPLTPSSLIDSALVVCGVDAFWMTGPRIEMPHQIGRLRVRRLPQAGEECVVRMFFREQDKAGTTYDFCIFGADGEWIAEVLGYRGMAMSDFGK